MSQDQPKKKVSLESPQETPPPVGPTTPPVDPIAPPVEPTTPPVDPIAPPVEPTKTVKGYVVPAKEEGLFHVEYEPRSGRFDAETGKKRHKPFVQKFSPRDFALQISTNDAGEPVLATVGWRINKFLHIPADKFLDGVIVRVTREKKDINIPIAEALDFIHGIIKAQDAEDKK